MNTVLREALCHLERGFALLPVRADKEPARDLIRATRGRTGWRQLVKTPASVTEVHDWLELDPSTGIGILTGEPSTLAVVDVDDLAAAPSLPTTACVATRRGFHAYSRTTNPVRTRELAWGSVRGDRAYVVAPCSRRSDGGAYAWELSPEEAGLADFAACEISAAAPPIRTTCLLGSTCPAASPDALRGLAGLELDEPIALRLASALGAPEGLRAGVTFSVKFRDVDDARFVNVSAGRRTAGTSSARNANSAKRLDRVERERWRKPTDETLAALVDEYLEEYMPSRGRRRSTILDYTNTLRGHVLPALDEGITLATIEARPELLDRYIARKRREGLAPKTVSNHLRTLSAMFEYAKRRRRMQTNPVELLEPLHVPTPETPVLTEQEIAGLLNAYRLAEDTVEVHEREWWALARRLTAFALGTALRRGEILALRWQDVEMLDRGLHVRGSFVRGEMGEPKSRAGRRTIGYGPRTADVLEEQWKGSHYRSPESLVFCHPALGTPLDPSKLSGYMRKAITKAGIERTVRPWHDLRHTALTHDAAVGNPAVYVQARAGHAQATMTERYVHAAQVAFPGAVERAEDRLFSGVAD